jgi:protein-tyrosine phosphatase
MQHKGTPLKTVLFLCTGNYYRSRFAEYLFNHLAEQQTLEWRAESLGFAPSQRNVGPISHHAVAGLERLGITGFEDRLPSVLTGENLETAAHIVAVQDEEHRPMMTKSFPDWIDRTEFWGVADIEFREPADALAELEREVRQLVERLNG